MERKVAVKYYGMLAEKIGVTEEMVALPPGEIILHDFFMERHPALVNYTFSVAVDLTYATKLSELSQPKKMDLMPPFAGG